MVRGWLHRRAPWHSVPEHDRAQNTLVTYQVSGADVGQEHRHLALLDLWIAEGRRRLCCASDVILYRACRCALFGGTSHKCRGRGTPGWCCAAS